MPMPRLSCTASFLLVLLFASAVFADEPIRVLPPGPTSDTPVMLRLDVWCNPVESHTTTISGTTIRIDVAVRAGTCPSPPMPLPYDVHLAALPSGEYTVDVHLHETKFTKRFIVRNAAPGQVEIRPFAVPTEPLGSRLRAVYPWGCAGENCRDVTVSVGGVVLPPGSIQGTNDGSIWFNAPPHAPGFVDVTITAYGQVFTTKNALYYFDRTKEPDPSLWERVLFPVLFNATGAHGSQWVSEAAIANPGRWFIENFNRIDAEPCIDWGCSQLLSPASFFRFDGAGHANGIALLVPRAEAEGLAFSLRVRDVARQAEGFGTEVPVVREAKMAADTTLTLLDVPLDPRYRTKLRVYAFEEHTHGAYVEVQRGQAFTGFPVELTRSCTGLACAATPWYGEADLPAGSAGETVSLYVRAGGPDSLSWAFASVTNNETQQVTIVTPDGEGGRPCNPCTGVN
jgi:hypothetical protein